MAYLDEVADTIKKMSEGIENAIQQTLINNNELTADLVREQLMSGQMPDGSALRPTYMTDPYFTEIAQKKGVKDVAGYARKIAGGYISYKMRITPPSSGKYLKLAARDRNTPNIYINGMYHRRIFAWVTGKEIGTNATASFADNIKAKYGANVLDIGKSAREYLVDNVLTKGIEDFYAKCGW